MVRMVWWNSYGSIRFFDCNKPRKLKTVSDSLMFRLRPHGSPKTQLSCLRSAASPFSIASTAKLDFQPLADRRSPFIQGILVSIPSLILSRTVVPSNTTFWGLAWFRSVWTCLWSWSRSIEGWSSAKPSNQWSKRMQQIGPGFLCKELLIAAAFIIYF